MPVRCRPELAVEVATGAIALERGRELDAVQAACRALGSRHDRLFSGRGRCARPPPRAPWGREALTAAELRVATLAAQGASNADIARELVVTSRTAETYLT